MYKEITNIITKTQDNYYASNGYIFCHKIKNAEEINQIIIKAFNHVYKELLFKGISDKKVASHISVQKLATMIGKGLAVAYLNKYILFNITTEQQNEIADDINFMQKNPIYHEKRHDKLETMFAQLKSNSFELKTMDTLISPHTFDSDYERELCFILLHTSFYESGIAGDSYSKDNIKHYTELYKKTVPICMDEGCRILNLLNEHKVILLTKDVHGTPVVDITTNIEGDLVASATFFKPYIAMSNKELLPSLCLTIDNKLTLRVHQQDYKNKYSKDIYNKPNTNFDAIIVNVDATPYKCNHNQTLIIFSFFQRAIEMPFKQDDPTLLKFCHIMYDINFAEAFKHTSNAPLMCKLMQFALDFTTLKSSWLHLQSENDAACNQFYNIISSYKFYIIGILNDVNIYKNFKFFYIPKFLSYTGRLFSHPLFLQLQGHKVAKSFIQYYTTNTLVEDDYEKLKAHINSILDYPSMGIDPEQNPISQPSLQEFKQEAMVLLNKYISSNFAEIFNIKGKLLSLVHNKLILNLLLFI